jgi:hypothetical protein
VKIAKGIRPLNRQSCLKKDEKPEWSNTEIADAVGCPDSHVSDTLNRWDPDDMNEDGTVVENEPIPIGWIIWMLVKIAV